MMLPLANFLTMIANTHARARTHIHGSVRRAFLVGVVMHHARVQAAAPPTQSVALDGSAVRAGGSQTPIIA